MKKILLSISLILSAGAFAQVVNTFPYNEDFELEIQGTTACGGVYTMLSAGWMNDLGDDIDWSSDLNGTGSANTGPAVDFNPGTVAGHYLYTEASGCNGLTANLESPWFDFTAITGGLEMSFAYHMFGGDMGTMAVESRNGLQSPWTTLEPPFTDNVNLWQIIASDITPFAGEDSVQFRIVGITGPGFGSDMAVDDFSVVETFFEGAIVNVSDIVCFGTNGGEMTAINNYGVAPITYLWDSGDTTATITGLTPGIYCVTMEDANLNTVVICDTIFSLATEALNAYVHTSTPWICSDGLGALVIDSIIGGAPGAFPCGISTLPCSGAVDSLQIGTNDILVGGTGYPSPLGNWYWGTRHQMVYQANELLAAGVQPGNLSGIAFFVDNLGTATTSLSGWNIKVGCTSASDATVFNDTATVEVYPATNITYATGWNWFSFANAFYWNGSDNIIVETCFNNSSFTNNPQMACNITPFTSTVYYRADNATVCGNSTITGTSSNRPLVQFENCASTPGWNYTYQWDTGASADTSYAGPGTYVFTVTDGVGCQIQDSVQINGSAPVNIDDAIICIGNPNDFSASTGFDSYLWNTSETTGTISITTGGTYYVEAIDSLGCFSSDTALVTTLPTPVISATSTDEMAGNDGYIDLVVNSAAFPFQFDWDTDGTGDNDDSEDQFGLAAGSYTVIVTDTNGCWSTLTISVGSQVGLDENSLSSFKVYPNPTNGVFNIQPLKIVGENASGQIVDVNGRLIKTIEFNGVEAIEVDLSHVDGGVYYIHLTVDEDTTVTRVVIK